MGKHQAAVAKEREEIRQREFEQARELLAKQLQWADVKNGSVLRLSLIALGVSVVFLVIGPPIPYLAAMGLGVGAIAFLISLLLSIASFLSFGRFAHDQTDQTGTDTRIIVRKLALFRYALLLYGFGVLFAGAAMALAAFFS